MQCLNTLVATKVKAGVVDEMRRSSDFMANQEHVKLIDLGTDTWSKWRAKHPQIHPDLLEAVVKPYRRSAEGLAKQGSWYHTPTNLMIRWRDQP
jgi:hypothetical protein